MPGPWDKYAAPAPQAAPGVIGRIPGAPKPADPYKERDQQLQEEAAARAREDQQWQREKFEREQAKGASDPKLVEAERTAAFLAARVAGGIRDINAALKESPDDAKPGVFASTMGGLPFVGDVARNAANSGARQRIEAAQMDVLDAALTLGTGAAYSKEQLAGYTRSYFPQLMDDDATVADKRVRLRRLLESAKIKAGNAAPSIDEALASFDAAAGDEQEALPGAAPPRELPASGAAKLDLTGLGGEVPPAPDRPTRDQIQFGPLPDEPGWRMSPDQERQWVAYLTQNKDGLTPEGMDAAFRAISGNGIGVSRDSSMKWIEWVRKGGNPNSPTIDYSGSDPIDQARVQEVAGDNDLEAVRGGAADTISFGTGDELRAGVSALAGSLRGEGSIGDLYARNVATERAIDRQLSADNPISFMGGQLAGAVAVPFGAGARGAAGLAKVGAVQGGAYGFGSAEGNALQRLPQAALGAGTGAAGGAALGTAGKYVGNALAKYAQRPSAAAAREEAVAGREVIEAGERMGVPIRQPDVRPGLRGDMAAVEKSPTAGPGVGNTLRADRDLVAGKVEGLSPGDAHDPYSLGNTVQGAMKRHGQETKDEATILYSRVVKAAPGHVAQPNATVAAIDDRIAQLTASGESANAAEIKVLEGIKSDFGKSGLSVESLQVQRRAMRQRLKDNGIDFGAADASYMDVLNVAGRELEQSLAGNPRALGALKTANAHYAERAAFRKEVARQFLGSPKALVTPEMAASRFVSMTKKGGDYNRFSKGFAKLDPVERSDFAATIAGGLGRGKSGEFSYGRFVSDIEGMNPRAIRDLFGEDGAKAIADLKMISAAKAGTAAGLNHSNTGSVTSRSNAFKNLVLGAFGGGVAGVPGAMAGMAASGAMERFTSGRAARMLLNPDFTKWLRQIPASESPEVINRHFARLNKIAARDPIFAADAKALQDFLGEAFSQSPGRLAAGENEGNGGRKPPQR